MDLVFAEAVNAVREIVEARQVVRPVPLRLALHLDASSGDLMAHLRSDKTSLADKIDLGFVCALKLADDAVGDDDPVLLRESVRQLFLATVLLAKSRHLGKGAQVAALAVARALGARIRKPPTMRADLKRRENDLKDIPADFTATFAGAVDSSRFSELANRISKFLASDIPIRVPSDLDDLDEPSAADLLVKAADRQAEEALQGRNDRTLESAIIESQTRIVSVSLEGFRGVPEQLSVTFGSNGSALSAILFGENGVGKSTIADAVEFALQGRVGRSANFDSGIAPAIRSLVSTSSESRAQVELSDGSVVERQALVKDDGRVVAEPRSVRMDFRFAPVTIKRSDILRFLDTEALERGTALLDYFPADASEIAMRPEEEIHQLEGEMAELRVRRSAYAAELADLLGVDKTTLSNAGLLNTVVRDNIMNGQTQAAFEKEQGWGAVDPEVRDALGRLMRTQRRLKEVKNRIQRAGEILNPVPYREQAATVSAIIGSISSELSDAFRSVAHEHPVDRIDVVFAESGPLSLDLVVRLNDGSTCFPQQLFSEAYRDLLALLFYVAVAKKASERGQAKVMILDDVLQSVDSKVRHAFVNYLLQTLPDWQLIFTVHDRLWREQLRDIFDAYGHAYVSLSIQGWSYSEGPSLSKQNVDTVDRDLRSALSSAEPRTVAILAGQLLEVIANQLSWRLALQITRREDDKYTLGDLWPPVRNRLMGTAADQVATQVATFRKMRNLTAHATIDSLGLTSVDTSSYAQAVLALLAKVRCVKCRNWIRGASGKCTCGELQL